MAPVHVERVRTAVGRKLASLVVAAGVGVAPLIATWAQPLAAGVAATDNQARGLSIAIRGGASLGAYEAGLNWAGLELLRGIGTASSPDGSRARRFDEASFAGTSAGGINALMSGLTWCARPESDGGFPNRVDNNLFRNLWLLPDINSLLPPQADSDSYLSDDALLSRRSLLEAAEKLKETWHSPAFRRGCRAPIGVTVTRVQPDTLELEGVNVENQRFYIPFELRVRADASARFAFDPSDFPTLIDPSMIPLPQRREGSVSVIDDQHVIDAVLASAAFPVGFGRKRLLYCRIAATFVATPGKATVGDAEQELSCPQGYELTEAEFADGGLFDNLPIGLARTLAEYHRRAADDALPFVYIYLEPDRTRYPAPKRDSGRACDGANPPAACKQPEYSLLSESSLLAGALRSARRYELYRELTSDQWELNLGELSLALAKRVAAEKPRLDCAAAFPFFVDTLDCATALRQTGRLLTLAYAGETVAMVKPYAAEKLRAAAIATRCAPARGASQPMTCAVDAEKLRARLAEGMLVVLDRARWNRDPLRQRVLRSQLNARNDRIIHVSNRGAPVTGSLLQAFAAFLDRKFREYDYYVGVYDAVVNVSETLCRLQVGTERDRPEWPACMNKAAERMYGQLAIERDVRARYVFARLAQQEFSDGTVMAFAYSAMPTEDRDMKIIHDALAATLGPGDASDSLFRVEETFFRHLKAAGFSPTPTVDEKKPLLTDIMDDPERWSYELVRRVTARLVYLEKEAEQTFKAREPDPAKRETSITPVLGAGAHILRTATYKHPDFTFAPSTAPDEWWGRYIVPFEFAYDAVDGDVL
ncbi:MAG: patatin-like phospholipase family protein, partial [Betaproteobacteria bacterium]